MEARTDAVRDGDRGIAHPGTAMFCESLDADWGEMCPRCGRPLPARPGPLRSWHSARALDPAASEQAHLAVARTEVFRGWHL